jgi:hypothetical protein
MTNGPEQPYPGEFPPLENSPVEYPNGTGLPPPVYGAGYPPPGPGYPPPATGYPPAPGYPPPPAYPAPGYQPYAGGYAYGTDPYDPYRSMKPPGTNGKAIAALACALAGLVFCGLPSIVGLILGIVAMRETKRTGQDGYGLALAGVIVGALVTVGVVLYFLFIIGLAASDWSYV